MGYWKERQIEEMQRGWTSPGDKTVCATCFDDYALQEFIAEHADASECSYCGDSSDKAIAAAVDDVIEHIKESLESEWGNADGEGVPYDSSEGGYQAAIQDTYDLLFDKADVGAGTEQLRQDLLNSFHNWHWCQRDWQLLAPQERLRYSWESFVEYIQTTRRYLFSISDGRPDEDDEGIVSPAAMLDTIGTLIRDTGLVRDLPAGTAIWRARPHASDQVFATPGELGTPPQRCATQPNRMSPAGIAMFYGALDNLTPLWEVSGTGCPQFATLARFVALRRLRVVDLSAIPGVPSIYDIDRRHLRAPIGFVRGFVSDLSKAIERNGREHVEYVPTQVVTEYFRHIFRDEQGPVQGLLYRSTRRATGVACVLFLDNEECGGPQKGWRPKDRWLTLDASSIQRCRLDSPPDAAVPSEGEDRRVDH